MKVAIIDYGMGNIASLIGALKYCGYRDITVSNNFNELSNAEKLILPGVGNFAEAASQIKKLDLKSKINDLIFDQNKSLLGICLGMQLLCKSSTEGGLSDGLGLVPAEVDMMPNEKLKIPHMGFNQVQVNEKSKLYKGLDHNLDFYFVHSFSVRSASDICQSTCCYGDSFIASFELGSIAGVQFHPEISQTNGLRLIKNFIELF